MQPTSFTHVPVTHAGNATHQNPNPPWNGLSPVSVALPTPPDAANNVLLVNPGNANKPHSVPHQQVSQPRLATRQPFGTHDARLVDDVRTSLLDSSSSLAGRGAPPTYFEPSRKRARPESSPYDPNLPCPSSPPGPDTANIISAQFCQLSSMALQAARKPTQSNEQIQPLLDQYKTGCLHLMAVALSIGRADLCLQILQQGTPPLHMLWRIHPGRDAERPPKLIDGWAPQWMEKFNQYLSLLGLQTAPRIVSQPAPIPAQMKVGLPRLPASVVQATSSVPTPAGAVGMSLPTEQNSTTQASSSPRTLESAPVTEWRSVALGPRRSAHIKNSCKKVVTPPITDLIVSLRGADLKFLESITRDGLLNLIDSLPTTCKLAAYRDLVDLLAEIVSSAGQGRIVQLEAFLPEVMDAALQKLGSMRRSFQDSVATDSSGQKTDTVGNYLLEKATGNSAFSEAINAAYFTAHWETIKRLCLASELREIESYHRGKKRERQQRKLQDALLGNKISEKNARNRPYDVPAQTGWAQTATTIKTTTTTTTTNHDNGIAQPATLPTTLPAVPSPATTQASDDRVLTESDDSESDLNFDMLSSSSDMREDVRTPGPLSGWGVSVNKEAEEAADDFFNWDSPRDDDTFGS